MQLKQLGQRVQHLIEQAPGSTLVRTDFMPDYYELSVRLRPEASRLGFTTGSVAQLVATGFAGTPVATWYEGDNPLRITMQLDSAQRSSYGSLENLYLTSPATGARVPLRQVAELVPGWQTGRLLHRNGVRTLTVLSETTPDVLPSQLLQAIQPAIARLPLPPGYRVEYGRRGRKPARNLRPDDDGPGHQPGAHLPDSALPVPQPLRETFLVMSSIPLSLFGAILGLVITHNPFGFTAFLGLISLSGIVVRNAIITGRFRQRADCQVRLRY